MVFLTVNVPRGFPTYLYVCFSLLAVAFAQSRQPKAAGQAADIRGVNLGGWFVTEPWITPSLYSTTSGDALIDEWHLCAALGKKDSLKLLEGHWDSFFDRDDFKDIAEAGLNAVRIPVGYWNVIDILDFEPYVAGAYPYIIRAVYWAAEFGLQATIDLHGVPGSQNGQDNSGLSNIVSFQANQTNFDRTLSAIRNLTEEFSRDIYNGTVTTIELMNEPRISDANFTMSELKAYYSAASRVVRDSSQGALRVLIHDAFWGPGYWSGFDPIANDTSTSPTWLEIDLHNYFAFAPYNNLPHEDILGKICNTSQYLRNTPSLSPVLVGEWSLETGTAPNASPLGRAAQSQARRTWFRTLFEAQLAAYSAYGWYFWTWKTEYDINTWSYRRGIQDGWIPPDVANTSQLVFPLLANGCINTTFEYTAPSSPKPQFGAATSEHQSTKLAVSVYPALLMIIIACLEIV
ncbi:hypothetical protein NliqN6_5831 [Naganishia liquefaciens]|uniref:glucan 1,3-beta-glucosidase n=1 Tax=Naganishia liquefaciens TaxID=104408 RepID=A0A8H3TYG1_9TREE|nr:hypothetical protein NliqN6_5831 [Naganishia liquefaciens]